MQVDQKEYKNVVVRLGENIHTTQANSTYDLKVNRKIDDIDAFFVQEIPTIVEYRDPTYGFSLPPTILVMLSTDYQKVTDIYTTPQLELLNLVNASKLLEKLIKLFDNAGWQRNNPYHLKLTPIKDLAAYFADPNHTETDVELWNIGVNSIGLSIKRQLTIQDQEENAPKSLLGKPEKFEDKYLVEVELSNQTI